MGKIVVLLICGLMLSSCGLHEFKSGDPLVALELSKESSKVACYQAQAMNGPDYTKLSDMAILAIEQQKAMIQIIGAVTGKSLDPCGGGTNLNDVLIADSRERNQTVRSVSGDAIGLGKWVVGGLTVKSVAGNMGNKVSTEGGDSSFNITKTNTRTTEVSTAAGEGTASTGGGDGLTTDPAITTDTTGTDPVTVTAE